MRIGQGYDVHRSCRAARSCSVACAFRTRCGLAGHSDADVLAHAVGDALLGALGEGDLGSALSVVGRALEGRLGRAASRRDHAPRRSSGLHRSRTSTRRSSRRSRGSRRTGRRSSEGLAKQLGVEAARVNVKLKSTDGLGAIGRGEGIAAQAVVLLEREDA